LTAGRDFKVGYSPERINPGDKDHCLETVIKIISGEDEDALTRIAAVYDSIIEVGTYRAPSIEVAEAAKVIENAQRDLNIALMNEAAMLFERLGIPTIDVLKAARTKWNFLPFAPGLVGGHCIGVDSYYITARAEMVGYHPEIVLAGRRVNDGMATFIGRRLVKMLAEIGNPLTNVKVGVIGLTFKEGVRDLRNSKVPDMVRELESWGIQVLVHDPIADPEEARSEYGIDLVPESKLAGLHGLVLAVPHNSCIAKLNSHLRDYVLPGGAVVDVKSALNRNIIPCQYAYWAL